MVGKPSWGYLASSARAVHPEWRGLTVGLQSAEEEGAGDSGVRLWKRLFSRELDLESWKR